MIPGRLLRVTLKNFRAVGDVTFEPAPDRTALVGGNGTGKSSILDGVAFVADLLRGYNVLSGDHRGNAGAEVLAFRDLRSAFAEPQAPVEFGLRVEIEDRVFDYSLRLVSAGESWQIAEERLNRLPTNGDGAGILVVLVDRDQGGASVMRASPRGQAEMVPVASFPRVPTLGLGIDDQSYPELHAIFRFIRGICLFRPTPVLMRGRRELDDWPDRYGRDLQSRLHRLLTEAPHQRALLLELMGEFVGWVDLRTPVRNGGVTAEFREAEHPAISLAAASDGTALEAWLLALALGPPDETTVFMIDEPGTVFFGASRQRPAEVLQLLSADRQVIVTSHAYELIDAFASRDAIWITSRGGGAGGSLRRWDGEGAPMMGAGEAAMLASSELAGTSS